MKAADENDGAILKNKTEAIFTQPDTVILPGGFESLEIRDLQERLRVLNLLNDLPDAAQQGRIGKGNQI